LFFGEHGFLRLASPIASSPCVSILPLQLDQNWGTGPPQGKIAEALHGINAINHGHRCHVRLLTF
jgi:hypothetical protein